MMKHKSFQIKPLSKGSMGDKPFDIPEPLPDKPFFINICGSRGSGKTVLLQNLIQMYDKNFDYIVVLSPSLRRNDDFDFLKEDDEGRITKIDDTNKFKPVIKEIIKSQDDIVREYGRDETPSVLLILDDILEENVARHSGVLEVLAFNSRHMKISVILASQMFRKVSNGIRVNATMNILFPSTNLMEQLKFVQEFITPSHKKEIVERMLKVFDIPYGFITMMDRTYTNKYKLKRIEQIWYKLDYPLIQHNFE